MVVTTSLEAGYLRATAQGRFVLAQANRAFFNMLDIAEDANARRILVDGRGITSAPRALERYLYGKFVAEAAMRLSRRTGVPMKFAYVLAPPVLDYRRLGEFTARKYGMNVRAFENTDDAVSWLRSRVHDEVIG
jgi:hypothetical protein